jgi:hypothetical protein
MDEDDRHLVRHEHVYIPQPSELKICLNRGQKGSYGWDIQYSGQDRKKILETIENVDHELRQKYIQNDTEKEQD